MTIEVVLIALCIGAVSAAALFLGLQVWEMKHRNQVAEYDAMLERVQELVTEHQEGETLAETAIRVGKQRKDQMRRARQRRAR